MVDTAISGTGEKETRVNEITPDNVATFRNFVLGYNSTIGDIGGVINMQGHNFNADIIHTIYDNVTITFDSNIAFIILWGILYPNNELKIDFISGDKQYDSIRIDIVLGGLDMYYGYKGEYTKVCEQEYQLFALLSSKWIDIKYNTITITNGELTDNVYQWFDMYSNINISTETTSITITDGMVFAYGYAGYCVGRKIIFFPPPVEQYQLIYAELDRSVIPNEATIEVKSNQSSSRILRNTFRQDQLSTIKTGKFQVPLWLVKLSNKGVEKLTDLRPLRKYIDRVVYSDKTSHISGAISELGVTVEGAMKPLDTNDKTISTTEWAKAVIEQEIRR